MKVKSAKLTYIERAETLVALCEINDINFNMLKVVEEALETAELLTKSVTKIDSLKPKREDLIEEIGDLELRLLILKRHMDMSDEVKDRVESKLALFKENISKGWMGTSIVVSKKNNDPRP